MVDAEDIRDYTNICRLSESFGNLELFNFLIYNILSYFCLKEFPNRSFCSFFFDVRCLCSIIKNCCSRSV